MNVQKTVIVLRVVKLEKLHLIMDVILGPIDV